MPRLHAALVWLALVSAACRPAHAPTARRIGMVTSIAGVLGLMATAALQRYMTKTDDLLSGFSILSGGGILLFAAGELSEPEKGPRRETETEKFRRWARILTSRAAGAAREGRCPRVRRLEKRVNVYDREVHDFVFMRDAAILKCLGGATPGLEPGAAEPSNPLHLPDPNARPDPSAPAGADRSAPAGADPGAPATADPSAPAAADPANPPPTLPPPPLPPPPRDPPDLRLRPRTVIPPTP